MFRIRVALGGSTQGPGVATFWFAGSTQAAADSAASAVATFMGAVDAQMVEYGTWAVEPTVAVINPDDGSLINVLAVAPSNGVGALNVDALPAATQGVLQLKTSSVVGGRLLRGRIYLPGPTEGANVLAAPSAVYKANMEAAGNALLAAEPTWGIWSRTGGVFHPITSVSAWSKWGILRSRRD